MKRLAYIVFGALLAVGCTADLEDKNIMKGENSLSEKILNDSQDCVSGSILVRFDAVAESRLAKCATRSGATRTGVQGVDALLDEVAGYAVEPVFVVTEKNREKVYERGLHLWYELRFSEECDMEAVAAKLAEVAEVERVQFTQETCRIGSPKLVSTPQIELQSATRVARIVPFNDAYCEYQWSINNLGPDSKVSDAGYNAPTPVRGADINVIPAWTLTKGDPSIVVAVMDEGVMYTHEDLAANMWVNSGEVADDGIDNDGNGYADDVYGFNFVRLDSAITWNDSDDSGHGTHVAGIISAVNNNGIGICGIAGGDGNQGGARIMSIQIFRGAAGATTSRVAKSMQYAADNGAHILQCSWGYKSKLEDPSQPGSDAEYKRSCRVEAEAIDYFIANAGDDAGPLDGGLVIFAGGNGGTMLTSYPAAYKPCIAVAAMSPSMRPTYFTDYGAGTDIIAPGGEAVYTNGAILSTVPEYFDDPSVPNYAMMQGTSQACPHVSGIAALGLSYAKKLGKRYTADEFRSMLLSATNDIDPYLTGSLKLGSQTIDYSSYKKRLGAGYVNAYKLLLQIDGTPYEVVEVGKMATIDLSEYFGGGVHNAKLYAVNVSDEDKANVGFGEYTYDAGKLSFTCSKSGAATISVTLLVGGGSLDNTNNPFPIEVTKSFVVMSRAVVTSNGGWL